MANNEALVYAYTVADQAGMANVFMEFLGEAGMTLADFFNQSRQTVMGLDRRVNEQKDEISRQKVELRRKTRQSRPGTGRLKRSTRLSRRRMRKPRSSRAISMG